MQISLKYLREHPNHIFVFGDNSLRRGKKGGAILRDEPNAYGFITKKFPSYNDDAYFKCSQYQDVFKKEMDKLIAMIKANPDKTFLISKIGSGLANKFHIFERIIEPNLGQLRFYKNVEFLW